MEQRKKIPPCGRRPLGHLRRVRGGGGGARRLHRQQPVFLVGVHDDRLLLPYGMISSELGTTYTGDGGLYDWINKAFPRSKWGARASWYYWINFPLWMASLAVMCPELLSVLTGLQFGWFAKLLIELAFIWTVTVDRVLPRVRQHHHSQHQRRHQNDPRADGRRARHRLRCEKRLCQRHGLRARSCRGLTCTVSPISR